VFKVELFFNFSSKKNEENLDYQIYNSESINIENDVIVKVKQDFKVLGSR
jgi:hypothetical protein